jgi:hypothetical protein
MAVTSGILPTFQDPVDMTQPTISAHDLSLIAADLLLHAEGPQV